MRAKIPPITRSKSPMLAGNKENEGNKINGGSAESLYTSATQRRGRAATPPSTVGNDRGRRPLNDLLSTSNSSPNPNPRRGRGRGVDHQPSPLPLRKCSPSPTPTTGTPRSTSCTRSSKLDKSEELQRSSGSAQYGMKDKALSRTFFQLGKTPSQNGNGMKKNCGLHSGNLPKSRSGSFGSAGRKRHDNHKEGHDSLRGRSQEAGLRLPMVGSPKPTSAAALQRPETAPLQKVYLNNCYATPAQKLLDKVYNYHSATPATRFKGRYQDSVPTHVSVGREDADFTPPTVGNGCEFTSAPTILRKGDFTPASNPDGEGGATPATRFKGRYQDSVPTHVFVGREDAVFTPPTVRNGYDFSPAPTILRKGGDFTPASNPDGEGGATPATRFKGRYQDPVPAHVLVGREDAVFTPTTIGNGGDFTPAPTLLRKGGDFTPSSNSDGKGGDFTPNPASNWNRGHFTPAQHNVHATPEQRTQVTPPVQPSISPEIHSQNLDELKDGHRCFGAGHVMAPVLGKVRDRRKCRPRGILTVGEATPILLDKNRRFSLDPVPMAASVKWISPRDAKNLTNLPGAQATPSSGFTQPSSSISSKYVTSQASSSPGFTQTTPSSVPNSKSPNPQATSLSGTDANSKGPSPQVTSLSGIDGSFCSGFSSSPIPQAGSLYGLTPATTRSGLSSKPLNHESTISSRVTPVTQNLSTVLPTAFVQEVPHIRGILSPMLTTGTGNLESTPSGNSSKFQNYVCTTPSGLTPELRNGRRISTLEYNQEISNMEANSVCGISPQVVSCCKSDIDISSQYWFHPNGPYQCCESQGMTPSMSSQSEFIPKTFPQGNDSHRARLSSANAILPSECTGGPEVGRPSNSEVSSMDKDNLRQEIQMPIPSSKGFTQVRISWRDGLMSRIFKFSELDSCDLTLEGSGKEEHKTESVSRENYLLNPENNTDLEYSCPFSNDLQLDAPFGSFEYMTGADANVSDPSVLLASSLSQENVLSKSLVRSFISPASQGLEAESTFAEDITSSASPTIALKKSYSATFCKVLAILLGSECHEEMLWTI
ncbi:hypothetical protein SUGI_0613110 [Cryptomeria japonica]|nr:hypothetical protein SUGI_0613110 [Cryptomeria japonica]